MSQGQTARGWARVGGLVLAAALAAVLAATGCVAQSWGPDGQGERPPSLEQAVDNGLAITLGPKALKVAGARLRARLEAVWPDGLTVNASSGGPAALAADGLGADGLSVDWEVASLHLSDATLEAGPAGLTARLSWSVEPLSAHVVGLSKEPCALTLGAGTLHTEGRVSLARGALAEVDATFVPAAETALYDADVPADACGLLWDPALAEDARAGTGAALGQAMWKVLEPAAGPAVVAALGLDVTGGATLSVGGDGLGAGTVTMQVGASEGASGGLAKLAGGALVVPLAVGVEVARHPCVGPRDLPQPLLQALPSLGELGDAAVSLHVGVIERALVGVWASGIACGDHLQDLAPFPADEARAAWPALGERLGGDAPLDLRVWPEAPLEVALAEAEDGVSLTLRLARVRMELMVTLDGARVRVVTLVASVAVGGGLEITHDGALWLNLQQLEVSQLETQPGLLADPPETLARSLAAPVVRGALVGYPLWTLPPVPSAAEGALRAHLKDGYVVFRAESAVP